MLDKDEIKILDERCERAIKGFDSNEEFLEYYENKMELLDNEVDDLERDFVVFNDVIRGYDNYYNSFSSYVCDIYGRVSFFIIFEVFVYLVSLLMIIFFGNGIYGIVFIVMIGIISLYNFIIFTKINSNKNKVRRYIIDKYDIDLDSMSEEEIGGYDMMGLENRIRINEIEDEIINCKYYIYWVKRRIYYMNNDIKDGH